MEDTNEMHVPPRKSWIGISVNWLQHLAIKVLASGKIPWRVAIIMDGNRRYARKKNVKFVNGHVQGFDKLLETMQWCITIGIRELTMYALSIDNLKRTKDEVQYLFDLTRSRIQYLIDQRKKLEELGVCVRWIGNPAYIPLDVRNLLARLMLETCNNKKLILILAFMYTSRDEITHAIRNVARGIENGEISVEDVDEGLLSKCLYTYKSSDPQLIIRTSGEVRLSDFMMWQSAGAYLYFANVLWPDFKMWSLLQAILNYQKYCSNLENIYQENLKRNESHNIRVNSFVDELNQRREASLMMVALLNIDVQDTKDELQEESSSDM